MTKKRDGAAVAIVDDDPAIRDALKLLIEVTGHQVTTFASATAFLEARPRYLACLILDQHMPRMTGLELAAQLRQEKLRIPILLITGLPSPAIEARAAQLDIEKVLEKPPDEDDLLAFVEAYC